ncbi:MAG: MBL fold metallo-hydrolase [Pirellulales bacterium]|nr:MBL fold metallo-hydrolase [Pirellulales bacterium]
MNSEYIRHANFGWLHKPPLPPACCHCLIVQAGHRVVLVDTGIGTHDIAQPDRRIGREAIAAAGFIFIDSVTAKSCLEQAGFGVSAVTDIVLTHCDPDHVGGLSDFPEATVHVSSEERANLDSDNSRYSPAQFTHGPHWRLYETDDSEFFGLRSRRVKTSIDTDIRMVPLFGHTLGHCGVAIKSQDRWTFHVGDAYYLRAELTDDKHPIAQLAMMRADDDRLRRESLDSLRRLSKQPNVDLCGYHDTSELPAMVPKLEDVASPNTPQPS